MWITGRNEWHRPIFMCESGTIFTTQLLEQHCLGWTVGGGDRQRHRHLRTGGLQCLAIERAGCTVIETTIDVRAFDLNECLGSQQPSGAHHQLQRHALTSRACLTRQNSALFGG